MFTYKVHSLYVQLYNENLWKRQLINNIHVANTILDLFILFVTVNDIESM